MSATVKIFEKPLSHVEIVDWIRNLQELQRYSFEKVQSSFDLRYGVRKVREDYKVNAKWDTYRNTKLLRDKVEDVTYWLEEFKNKMNQFGPMIKKLKNEKDEVDKEINKMDELFRVSSECNSIRDQRMLLELVNDHVRDELRREILLAEENKKMLQKLSHCAWEKLNYLDNLQFRLNQELEQKIETMVIDTDQANLDTTSDKISFKVDALKIAKHSETKEIWIKRQQTILAEAEYQLSKSIEARETLFLLRGKARDMMDAQRMATENVLRRRIFENENSIKELEWHKKRIETAMGKFYGEMTKLEDQIQEFMRKLKLAETRLINKTYRAIGEKGLDLANEAIRLEARTLNDMIKDLRKKSGATKVSYNELERQFRAVNDDLQYKYQSLELDKKVYEMKENLKIISKQTQFERSLMLVNFRHHKPEVEKKDINMTDTQVQEKLETGFKKLASSNSKSLLKKYLTQEVFDKLKFKKTSFGSTLLDCIQSGLENHDSGVGIYAPDAEAYTVFADIFDPIIEDYHGGFKKTDKHPPKNWGDVSTLGNLDPTGEFVVSTRVRCGRSIEGYPFNPCLTESQYKEMEEKVSSTLSGLEGELKGKFYPLTGMSKDVQQQLIDDHFLFKEGDRFLQAANACRFWPTGRGIFHNDAKTFLVWCNEEDHLRLISMQMGGDLGMVYRRLVTAVNDIEKRIPFSHNDRLGFLTFCPTNLGTTVRASVHIQVPKLAADLEKLEEIAGRYNLQVRGTRGEHTEAEGGVYDISNKRRMGLTEYDAVKEMHDGIAELIKIESSL